MTIAVILVRQIHLVVIDTNDWSSADDGITIISHENVNVPSINFYNITPSTSYIQCF
jgi:hypothetical protein